LINRGLEKILVFLISIIIHGGFFINSGGNVDVTAFGGTFLRRIDCRRSPGFCALLGVDDKRKRGLFHYQHLYTDGSASGIRQKIHRQIRPEFLHQ